MKNLMNLGKTLSKNEQQTINGGVMQHEGSFHCHCKNGGVYTVPDCDWCDWMCGESGGSNYCHPL